MALFHYKCTDYYSPKDEQGFRWDDPDVGIKWPVENPILSQRDAAAPRLKALPPEKLF
jgi:dTDP-4-dehydrorhamnose 3,5-epimerase